MNVITSPYLPRGEAFVVNVGDDLAARVTRAVTAELLKEDEFLAQRNFTARMWRVPMLQERMQVERISVHASCGTCPVIVVNHQCFAYWCPSCRTDLQPRDLTARPYYETGPRRLAVGGPFLGSISA